MELNLEDGKHYLDRKDNIVKISSHVNIYYPFVGDNNRTYTKEGKIWTHGIFSEDDLVKEVKMEELNLEVGKKYLDTKGNEVTISKNNHEVYPFIGNNEETYTRGGTCYLGNAPSEHDLVKEVKSNNYEGMIFSKGMIDKQFDIDKKLALSYGVDYSSSNTDKIAMVSFDGTAISLNRATISLNRATTKILGVEENKMELKNINKEAIKKAIKIVKEEIVTAEEKAAAEHYRNYIDEKDRIEREYGIANTKFVNDYELLNEKYAEIITAEKKKK